MTEINVRMLDEADWQAYRDLRLEALRESPGAFVTSDETESPSDHEPVWRARMRRARWFVADRDGTTVGVIGLGVHDADGEDGELLGLWVNPQSRRGHVAWALVRAAAEQAAADGRSRLYFWVGSDNGPAVAFASTIGFSPTSERRPAGHPTPTDATGEVAMALALTADPTSVKNPLLP